MRLQRFILGTFLLVTCLDANCCQGDQGSVLGSVTFAFDGGTLECTFGTMNGDASPHVAMIVYPASVDAFERHYGIKIARDGVAAIVLVSDDRKKYVQLTRETVNAWSRDRVNAMSQREATVGENAFVAAVVHAVTNRLPLSRWGVNGQAALESGNWCQLFAEPASKPR